MRWCYFQLSTWLSLIDLIQSISVLIAPFLPFCFAIEDTSVIENEFCSWYLFRNQQNLLWCTPGDDLAIFNVRPKLSDLRLLQRNPVIPDTASHLFLDVEHWGWVTDICVSNLTIIGSDNGLSPGRRQAIIWTNAGIWLIRTLETNFSEIFRDIHIFLFKNMHFKMSFFQNYGSFVSVSMCFNP